MFHYFPVDYKPEFAPGERGKRAERIYIATNYMIDGMDNARPTPWITIARAMYLFVKSESESERESERELLNAETIFQDQLVLVHLRLVA